MGDLLDIFDFSVPLSQWLYRLLALCLGLSLTVLTLNNVWRPIRKLFSESILDGVLATITVAVSFAWMVTYIFVLVFETIALDAATLGVEPPVKLSYIVVPVVMSIAFPFFVANSWRLGVVVFGATAVGILDLFGNATIADAFLCVKNQFATPGAPEINPALEVWVRYYLEGNQLRRVASYVVIVQACMIIYLFYRFPIAEVTEGDDAVSRGAKSVLNAKTALRLAATLLYCMAIIGNESWIWSVRLDRERQLDAYGMSLFHGLEMDNVTSTREEVEFQDQVRELCL
ncbi:hypothetical protein [Pseudooceanicola sp. LIPI14-2-Ac024]|uniref:hypothetical protein n=1 Tax=Pseudooceanicola sp. LIPI14-2-Ac024 TaxID=3344875 RepID=UPI0035CFB9DC